jgi:cystathionine beta-lyase/cystathionine gamma-synthase
LLVAVDNTFLTPYLQNPLRLGADLVIHSATKMIGGHSDLTAGVAVAKDEDLAQRLYFIQNACGAVLSPDDSYLAHRGLSTLPVRMRQASANAARLAAWLAKRLGPERVYYPGLPSHPGYALCQRQMRGFGQMLTFRLDDRPAVQAFAAQLRLAAIGAGFGGTETIVSLPELHCHAALTPDERAARDLGGDVVRVSVGLESAHAILDDFEQALTGLN